MDDMREEDKIEFIDDLVPVKSKVNQTVLWKSFKKISSPFIL